MKKLYVFFVTLILMMATGICVHAAEFNVKNLILPYGNAYEAYDAQIEMEGGNDGYTFQLASNFKPAGLEMSSDGHITGIPTTSGAYKRIGVRISHVDGTKSTRYFSITIYPRQLKVHIIAPSNIVYDGNEYSATVETRGSDGELLGDEFTPVLTYNGQEGPVSDAAIYYIDVISPSGCTVTRTGDTHLIINEAAVTQLTVFNKVFTYDGQPHGINSEDVILSPADAGYTVEYRKNGEENYTTDEPISPGLYMVRAHTINPNYRTVYTTATINIMAPTVNFNVTNINYIYDGQPHEVTVEPDIEGFTNYTVTYADLEGNPIEGKPINSGEYKIVIALNGEDSYVIGSVSADILTIEQRELCFTVDNASWDYDATEHVPVMTVSPEADSSLYTIKYVKHESGEEVTAISDVGVYDIVITLTDSDNYKIAEASSKSITVNAKTVNFRVSSNERTYTGDPQTVNTVSVPAGIAHTVTYVNSKDETIDQPVDADTYNIKITINDPGYTVGSISPNKLRIRPKQVSFTVSNNEAQYDGDPHTATVEPNTAIPEDAYTVEYVDNEGNRVASVTEAGEYTIVITTNSNYTIVNEITEKMIVKPIQIGFTVSNNEVQYDGDPHTATVEPNTVVPEDAYTVEYVDNEGNRAASVTEAGEYTIIITFKNSNYIVSEDFSAVMKVIAAAYLNIGNSPAAMIYRDSAHQSDKEWHNNALNYLTQNGRFSEEYLPRDCRADIHYTPLYSEAADSEINPDFDKYTLIVKDITDFTDPGMVVNDEGNDVIINGTLAEVENIEGLYTLTYTHEDTELTRYVMVVGKSIGDINGDGVVNAVDANHLDGKNSVPGGVTEARIWDVNKDGMIDKNDALAIRNRFRNKLISYYPWI